MNESGSYVGGYEYSRNNPNLFDVVRKMSCTREITCVMMDVGSGSDVGDGTDTVRSREMGAGPCGGMSSYLWGIR